MSPLVSRGKTILLIASVIINIGLIAVWGKKTYSRQLLASRNPESTFLQNKWNGFDIVEFTFKGSSAKIVLPENANAQRDWVWRTQFWGEQPQVDVALLKKGFHVVHVDVTDLYGNSVAIDRFNDFYGFVIRNFRLNEKVVLEGLSRGGLDAYN